MSNMPNGPLIPPSGEFSSLSVDSVVSLPDSGVVAGSYSSANITVNDSGLITNATDGGGGTFVTATSNNFAGVTMNGLLGSLTINNMSLAQNGQNNVGILNNALPTGANASNCMILANVNDITSGGTVMMSISNITSTGFNITLFNLSPYTITHITINFSIIISS